MSVSAQNFVDLSVDQAFEQGSLITVNSILAFLHQSRMDTTAQAILEAWENGTIQRIASGEAERPAPLPPETFEPGPAKQLVMTRDQATSSGFTGSSCAECGSMQMVRNGTCEKCTSCGTTTGCS